MSDYTCGERRCYVRRPLDIQANCVYDGVCLRCGKAVDSSHEGSRCACNSDCNIDNPRKATHWEPIPGREAPFDGQSTESLGMVICVGENKESPMEWRKV